MKQRLLCSMMLILCVLGVQAAMLGVRVYNVRDYGAKGDGNALDHVAINKAIEACVAKDGGGQVVLTAGTYLCGSIRLKSNIDLHLMAGAKILAAPAEMKATTRARSLVDLISGRWAYLFPQLANLGRRTAERHHYWSWDD